jgi:hypothetical protein
MGCWPGCAVRMRRRLSTSSPCRENGYAKTTQFRRAGFVPRDLFARSNAIEPRTPAGAVGVVFGIPGTLNLLVHSQSPFGQALENDNAGAVAHCPVEFKNVFVQHPDATGRCGVANSPWLIGPMNAIERIPAIAIQIQRPCPERIVWASGDALR